MAWMYQDEGMPLKANPLVEANTQIQRTLVVGLGGTGGEVIKRLKRRLGRLGEAGSHIRYLSLDTDVRTWLASAQFPALEPRERVLLSCPHPETVLESPHLYPAIQHLFHQGRKVDLSILGDANGAGLMPVVGRTAFHLNVGQIYAQFQRALRDLQALPPEPGGQPLTEEFRIYLVGSVAGGTGAGCFAEAAVLLRHVFRSFRHQVIGILCLPEAFAPALRGQQLDAQSRGNAYAVLKELQYLQDGPVHWDDTEAHTFRFQIGGDLRSVILTEKPFHIFYVIDHQNQEGGALRNLSDIYEMAAQQLSVEIGSPFGAKFASAQANDRAIKGLAPCPETGRPANISSLATAALIIPVEKLVRHCVRRWVRDVVAGRLLGKPEEEAAQRASEWFAAAGLEEREGHRSISRALLTEPGAGREWTASEFADVDGVAACRTGQECLTRLSAQEDYFAARGLPGAEATVQENARRLHQRLGAQLRLWLAEGFTTSGGSSMLARHRAITSQFDQLASQLGARQRADEAARMEIAAQLEGERTALLTGGVWALLTGKRREAMRLVGRLQADLFQLDLDLAARGGALRLVGDLQPLLADHRRRAETLVTTLERSLRSAEADLAQEQLGEERGSGYALETDVIRPEDYPRFYERFKPTLESFSLDWETLGSNGEVSSQLFRHARRHFEAAVADLDVVDVLQEFHTKEVAFALLDDLARRCRPFWTAVPRGGGAFSDVVLIGSPGVSSNGKEGPARAEPLLQEWVDLHAGAGGAGLNSNPTYVALGSPSAIIFSRQTHGARLHYMRQVLDYREQYHVLAQQRGYPLHFKPSQEALPELQPDDAHAIEAWALAVAYGMAAVKTFGWVWALESEQRRDGAGYRRVDTLLTGSLWDLAAEIALVEPHEIVVHSPRFLHVTRTGALAQLSQRREWITAAQQQVSRRVDELGKQVVGAELARYLDEAIAPRLRRSDEMEAATLSREAIAIRRFLERLHP